jgi:hypothetical protein
MALPVSSSVNAGAMSRTGQHGWDIEYIKTTIYE